MPAPITGCGAIWRGSPFFICGKPGNDRTERGIMKKWAAVGCAVVALGAIWTGTAWYTGKQLEAGLGPLAEATNLRAQQIGLKMDTPLSFELMSFERGVFTSQARYRVLAESPRKNGPPVKRDVQFVARIDHGPFPLSRLSQGHFLPAMVATRVQLVQTPSTDAWFAAAKGAAPVVAEAVASYSRNVSGTLDVAPATYSEGGTTLSFSGLKGRASVAPDGKHTTFSLAADHLDSTESFDRDGSPHTRRLSLQGLALSHDSTRATDGAITSGTQAGVKQWTVEIDDVPVALRDLALSADAAGNESAMSGKLAVQLAGIDVRGKPVASVRLAANAVNLDLESFRAFREVVDQTAGHASTADKLEAGTHVIKFLLARPGFSIEPLQVDTASGPATLRLDIALDAPSLWNRAPAALIKEAVKKLDFRVSVPTASLVDLMAVRGLGAGLPEAAARDAARQQADALRDRFVQRQWGRLEDGKLVANLNYQGGQVDFNGERMSVEALLARLMAPRAR